MNRFLAPVLASAVLLIACGDDPEAPAEAVPTVTVTTTVTPAPVVETPAPTETTPAAPPEDGSLAGLSSPELAAQRLYDDWHAQDREFASTYAAPAAVDVLFAQSPGPMEFIGCEPAGDAYDCFYYYEGGGLNIEVVEGEEGYSVQSVLFVAD